MFEIVLDEIQMNNAWRMKCCKSKCAEKQEVNSALLYEQTMRRFRGKSLLLMCGSQQDCLRSRWSTNPETVIHKRTSLRSSMMIICPWHVACGYAERRAAVGHLAHRVVWRLLADRRPGEDPGGEALQPGRWDRLPHQHPGRPGEQLALQAARPPSTSRRTPPTHALPLLTFNGQLSKECNGPILNR